MYLRTREADAHFVVSRMPVGSKSSLRPAVRPKIVKKKTNKFVRFHADLFKRMAVRNLARDVHFWLATVKMHRTQLWGGEGMAARKP